jgi:hypothetical protein
MRQVLNHRIHSRDWDCNHAAIAERHSSIWKHVAIQWTSRANYPKPRRANLPPAREACADAFAIDRVGCFSLDSYIVVHRIWYRNRIALGLWTCKQFSGSQLPEPVGVFMECQAQFTDNVSELGWIFHNYSFAGEVLNAIFEATTWHTDTRTNTTHDRFAPHIR